MADIIPTEGFNVPPAGVPGSPVLERGAPQPVNPTLAPPAPYVGVPPVDYRAQFNTPAAPAAPAAPAPAAGLDPAMQGMLAQMLAAAGAQPPAAPAPAAPAAPAAVEPITGLAGIDVNEIEDPAIRGLAGLFLQSASGLDIDRVLGKAIATGNAADIDLPYLYSSAGEKAQYLHQIAQGIVGHVAAEAQAAEAAVFELAGGAPQWQAAASAFNQAAPQHYRAVIANMIDSGDRGQMEAAARMVLEFTRQTGQIATQGAFLTPQAGMQAGSGALGKDEFQAALKSLNRNSPSYEADRVALLQRRTMGKQLGR